VDEDRCQRTAARHVERVSADDRDHHRAETERHPLPNVSAKTAETRIERLAAGHQHRQVAGHVPDPPQQAEHDGRRQRRTEELEHPRQHVTAPAELFEQRAAVDVWQDSQHGEHDDGQAPEAGEHGVEALMVAELVRPDHHQQRERDVDGGDDGVDGQASAPSDLAAPRQQAAEELCETGTSPSDRHDQQRSQGGRCGEQHGLQERRLVLHRVHDERHHIARQLMLLQPLHERDEPLGGAVPEEDRRDADEHRSDVESHQRPSADQFAHDPPLVSVVLPVMSTPPLGCRQSVGSIPSGSSSKGQMGRGTRR
jgi:hypothetical protein